MLSLAARRLTVEVSGGQAVLATTAGGEGLCFANLHATTRAHEVVLAALCAAGGGPFAAHLPPSLWGAAVGAHQMVMSVGVSICLSALQDNALVAPLEQPGAAGPSALGVLPTPSA